MQIGNPAPVCERCGSTTGPFHRKPNANERTTERLCEECHENELDDSDEQTLNNAMVLG